LVLVAHDTNDVFLEVGKSFVYRFSFVHEFNFSIREMDIMTNITFVMILISWIVTRLGIFPFMIIRSTMFESLEYIPTVTLVVYL
jgi:hypothetical protein